MNVQRLFCIFVLIALFYVTTPPRHANSFEYCNHIAIAISSLYFSMTFAPSSMTVVGGSEVDGRSSLIPLQGAQAPRTNLVCQGHVSRTLNPKGQRQQKFLCFLRYLHLYLLPTLPVSLLIRIYDRLRIFECSCEVQYKQRLCVFAC
jgi:hypothetical protein